MPRHASLFTMTPSSLKYLLHSTQSTLRLTPQRLPHLLPQPPSKPLRPITRCSNLRRRQRARKPELAWDPLDAVRGVDVLDERDLVAGCAALARDDGRVGEEVVPYLWMGGLVDWELWVGLG